MAKRTKGKVISVWLRSLFSRKSLEKLSPENLMLNAKGHSEKMKKRKRSFMVSWICFSISLTTIASLYCLYPLFVPFFSNSSRCCLANFVGYYYWWNCISTFFFFFFYISYYKTKKNLSGDIVKRTG